MCGIWRLSPLPAHLECLGLAKERARRVRTHVRSFLALFFLLAPCGYVYARRVWCWLRDARLICRMSTYLPGVNEQLLPRSP